ncbi:signal peptidase II [Lichenifustis flavocetrariae]|uniref:Lipoprotein signal peptidase n=1 Tax=Lichenifustis flavocetrariae TaxID=2949735 RepID=A0AA41YXQ1_9HYPH|nr:signal peptidase II [Lichenifustis flavocetrariae]MCW6510491.1 signal peptidase II [Lichenifustis flavocetrariae]
MVRLRLIGAIVALLALVIDQASKQWLLHVYGIADKQPVRVASFLDIVLAWNRGISYSLFTTDSARGPWILLALTLTATVLLMAWLWRTDQSGTAFALGLLIGGALGNAYDRFAYGAVVDFVHFHIAGFSWYIFNGADVAICMGVAVLLLSSLITQPAVEPASKMPKNTG